VLDTLAAGMKGDENDSADIGAFIQAAKVILSHTGAHIAVAHHLGKDKTRGARGHSKLLGDFDGVFELKDNQIQAEKLKASKEGGPKFYTIGTVVLGKDEDGDPITSVVLRRTDKPVAKPGSSSAKVLELLTGCKLHVVNGRKVVLVSELVSLVQGAMAAERDSKGKSQPSSKGARTAARTKVKQVFAKGVDGLEADDIHIWIVGAGAVMFWPE